MEQLSLSSTQWQERKRIAQCMKFLGEMGASRALVVPVGRGRTPLSSERQARLTAVGLSEMLFMRTIARRWYGWRMGFGKTLSDDSAASWDFVGVSLGR